MSLTISYERKREKNALNESFNNNILREEHAVTQLRGDKLKLMLEN